MENSKKISIDQLPLAAVLVSSNRAIVAANKMAYDLFEGLTLSKDLSSIIRNPDILETFSKVLKKQKPLECDFVRKGRSRRTFKATISPYFEKGENYAFIALYETTVASEAERMRSSFVADVSHELRSPLTTLIATTETLKGKAGKDEKTRDRFIDLLSHETTRMLRIVNDLLNLSTTEQQEHILPNDNVNLGEIVKDIENILEEKAHVKGMVLNLELSEDLPDTRGDYDELYQVVHNLIDNAIKYGEENTKVDIKTHIQNNLVQVSVINQGNHIAEEHIPRLTERFYRVDKSRSRDMGGTGLGLAIVKHIINRHLGVLNIESHKETGTCFCVSFPIKTQS